MTFVKKEVSKKSINVIHFVESNYRHPWLEKLIQSLDQHGFSQQILTIEPPGEIHEFFAATQKNIGVERAMRGRMTVFRGLKEIRKNRKNDSYNIVLAYGHPAAFISALATCFFKITFVLSHMQQPRYFEFMPSRIRGNLHERIYKFYVRRAEVVFSLSKEVYEKLILTKIDTNKIVSLNIGLDFTKLKNQIAMSKTDESSSGKNPKILMVGRLSPEKNYILAINTFKKFLQIFPNGTLRIAGDGPQKSEIIGLIQSLNLHEKVQLLGQVSNVPELMIQSDLLLHLANTESYGQIYIESLICHLPVISSRTGIAIDLQELADPNIRIVFPLDSELICLAMEEHFRKPHPSVKRKMEQFSLYHTHEDSFVYETIAEALIGLKEKIE